MTHCPETVVVQVQVKVVLRLVDFEDGGVFEKFPKLSAVQNSMLVAVGVDYQAGDYVLREGDEVSLFPPVQGG